MSLQDLALDSDYHTGRTNLVDAFYRPCLQASIFYDRAAGFFRSSVLELVGDAFALFAIKGGTARVICSPRMDEADATAIASAYEKRDGILEQLLDRDMDALLTHARTARAVELLATLIRTRALDMRIAIRTSGHGLYHEKLGIFRDRDNHTVSFRGSSNESRAAWHPDGNHESFEVFCSWQHEREMARCDRHRQYFEHLWNGQISGVAISTLPRAFHGRLLQYSNHAIEDFATGHATSNHRVARTLLPHQIESIASWQAAGCRGIFKHATGSGKTFTALMAMKEQLSHGRPVLIVVPSILLLEQWHKEVAREFPDAAVLRCGGGHNRWKDRRRLDAFTTPASLSERIVLATMQTAASPKFLRDIRSGLHLMLVADEVHQTGSPVNRRMFRIVTGPRLGLSATPERFGDLDGTAALFKYFGSVLDPQVSLADAIRAGRLVPYHYTPHVVDLSADELDAWDESSRKISRYFAQRHSGNPEGAREDAQLQLLLIQRARIAKRATAKVQLANTILASEVRGADRWLVYCEDRDQLGQVRSILRATKLKVLEYHTGMDGSQEETLEEFRYYGGVMLSIRCLDEGVDIPEISHALILASSQNPRQFIQRRGRVLRSAPHKHIAYIHDALVIPPTDDALMGLLALTAAEVARAGEFAGNAINGTASTWLSRMLIDRGWDASTLLATGTEDPDLPMEAVDG